MIHDTDKPVDVDAVNETASGPGPYPWTFARDVRLMCKELKERRAADLTASDLASLQWLHVQALAIQHERSQAGSDGFPDPARAIGVLERLMRGAK